MYARAFLEDFDACHVPAPGAAGRHDRGGGPIASKCRSPCSRDGERADRGAWEQRRPLAFLSSITAGIGHPGQSDALSRTVRRADVQENAFVASDAEQHAEMIRRCIGMGITDICPHNVEQEELIDDLGRKVLPLFLDG